MKRTSLCEQVIQLAMQGYSVGGITKTTGFPTTKVRNCVNNWRKNLKAERVPLPPCVCGLPSNHRDICPEKPLGGIPWQPVPVGLEERSAFSTFEGLKKHYRVGGRTLRRWLKEAGISRERRCASRRPREKIEELSAEGWSVRTIASELGTNPRAVREAVARWRDALRAKGEEIPSCKCGGAHNHSFFCEEKKYGEGIGRRARRQPPADFEAVAPMLSVAGLSRHYRTGHAVVSRWLDEFPELPRISGLKRPKPLRPIYKARSGISDATYNLIERCVPTSYAPDVRADIISTIYLAVLDGSLPEERLLLDGRSVLYRFVRSNGLLYQTALSIEQELDDEGRSFLDMLADDDALIAFDRIFDDDD